MPPRYSVVIPVYNSAPVVAETVSQTIAFFAERGDSCQVITVNDGSTDRSWEVLRGIAAAHPCVMAIDLGVNRGQHTATLCGLKAATGDTVITLDDDLQYPPGEIARLIDKAGEGYDLVCGRSARGQGAFRAIASRMLGLIDQVLFGRGRAFVFTSFRLMRREVVDRLCEHRLRDPYLRGLLVRCASNPANVPVTHRPRTVGRSGYGPVQIARLMVRIWRTYRDLHPRGSHHAFTSQAPW